ncbi:PREDICTED: delta-type opioid receptor-like [Branchiostoma belcheri]|uniref:Delta-type opioid receptor-like n=1 Tax=Branchiostoma belcheri TaxID=7741 RepID=A0A6P4YGL7_BRABE|nr:PREDICTED: delta-type opioid receptor-like [Branchiostoma belcheri]
MAFNATFCGWPVMDNVSTGNPTPNCTISNTTVQQFDPFESPSLLPLYAFFFIITLAGLVGNLLIIIVILAQHKSKSAAYIYILNLAIADLLMLTMVPFRVTAYIVNHAWIFGHAMCQVYFLIAGMNMFNVVFILMAMSVDRYFSVSQPFRSLDWKTRRKAKFVCFLLWLFAAVNDVPYVVFAQLQWQESGWYCSYAFPGLGDDENFWNRVSEIYVTIISFIVPLPVITVTHICIVWHMRRNQPQGKISRRQQGENGNRRELDKTARVVTAVVAVFLICWLPKNIVYLAKKFGLFDVPNEARVAVELLLIANSAVNPYLYTIFGEQFRDSLRDMCCGKRYVNPDL